MGTARAVGEFARGRGKELIIAESAPFGGVYEGVWGDWFEVVEEVRRKKEEGGGKYLRRKTLGKVRAKLTHTTQPPLHHSLWLIMTSALGVTSTATGTLNGCGRVWGSVIPGLPATS